MTSLNSQTINNGFGVQVNNATRAALKDPDFKSQCLKLWAEFGGLLVVRGDDLSEMTPQELVDFSEVFGDIEQIGQTAREKAMVGDYPILRIGNVRDDKGELRASLSRVPQLTSDEDVRYNPATRRPVWHTDSLFRENPPIGSVFHCRQAPPNGGETLFADMHAGYERLHDDKRAQLDGLEAVCSLAHHDKKINAYSPDYPILNAEQRAANPPQRVPLVLTHPTTGRKAIYGLNSSTCAVVPKGTAVSDADMDRYDLEGIEDDSVQVLRELLPELTGPETTVRWRWKAGDIAIWDNRCTLHSGTGYDYERYTREMWRLTLVN